MIKLCKDCQWCLERLTDFDTEMCMIGCGPNDIDLDPVIGLVFVERGGLPLCVEQRESAGKCGPAGRSWEKREDGCSPLKVSILDYA